MELPIKKVQEQQEKVIDYHYIRNLKNKEVRKNRFKQTASQRIFRIVLIVTLLAELAYLGFVAALGVRSSQLFVLKNVQVTGTRETTPEEIKKLVLTAQKNAWSIDLTEVKLRLENHPWIQRAVIWRELPAGIRVHITERQAMALALSGNLYLIDRSGKVIQQFNQEPKFAGLPVLTGIPDLADEEKVLGALSFVREVEKDRKILGKISEIHVYDKDNTIVYLKGISFGLFVSKDGMLPMIKKCLDHLDFIQTNFANQKLVDLRYEGQIVLKHSYKQEL